MTSWLGGMVRGLRDRAGLTQEELAEGTGLSVRAIRNLELGRTARPQCATVRLLADALGLDDGQRRELLAAARLRDPAPRYDLPAAPTVLHGRSLLVDAAVRNVARGARLVVFDGGPGSGKTAALVHIAEQMRSRFDTVLYLELAGEGPAEIACRVLRALGTEAVPAAESERLATVRAVLAERRVLLAMDDVTDEHQVRPLLPGGDSAVVVAARYRLLALAEHAIGRLGPLTHREGLLLLAELAGRSRVLTEPAAAADVVAACAGVPLALHIAGSLAAARPDRPLSDLAAQLADPATRLDRLRAGDLSVRAAITAHLRGLPPATLDLVHRRVDQDGLDTLSDAHLVRPDAVGTVVEPLVALHLGQQHRDPVEQRVAVR